MNDKEEKVIKKCLSDKKWILSNVRYAPYYDTPNDDFPIIELNGLEFIYEVKIPIKDKSIQIVIDYNILRIHSISDEKIRYRAYVNTKKRLNTQIVPLGNNTKEYSVVYEGVKDNDTFMNIKKYNLINSKECILIGSKDLTNMESALAVIEFYDKIAKFYMEPFYLVVNGPVFMTAYPESTTNIDLLFEELDRTSETNPYKNIVFYYKNGSVESIGRIGD